MSFSFTSRLGTRTFAHLSGRVNIKLQLINIHPDRPIVFTSFFFLGKHEARVQSPYCALISVCVNLNNSCTLAIARLVIARSVTHTGLR